MVGRGQLGVGVKLVDDLLRGRVDGASVVNAIVQVDASVRVVDAEHVADLGGAVLLGLLEARPCPRIS